MHIRAGVDPLVAALPAFHAGRRIEALPHLSAHAGGGVGFHRRQFQAARKPQRSHHGFRRGLDSGEAHRFILEEVGVEHRAQHRGYIVVRIEVRLRHNVDGFGVFGVFIRPLRDGCFVRNEEVIQVARDKARRGFLLADDVHHILAVEVAGFAEEMLIAVVVVGFIVVELPSDVAVGARGVVAHLYGHIVRVHHAPTGEGARALFDVFLCVVAHAHREQLQYFPAVVLVDGVFVIVLIIQPHQHARIAGQVHQQIAEVAHAAFAEHIYLIDHHSRLN